MKATKQQIAEARKRGIVPGVVIECSTTPGDKAVVPKSSQWELWSDGGMGFKCAGFDMDRIYIYHGKGEKASWAKLIAPPQPRKTTPPRKRVTKPIVEPTRIDKILDGVNAISERLALLEASVAVIRSGATFMQQLEQDVAAIEAAKVPKFGDRVDCNGIEWKVACDWPSEQGYYRLVPSKCGNLNTCIAKRHEFTIIP